MSLLQSATSCLSLCQAVGSPVTLPIRKPISGQRRSDRADQHDGVGAVVDQPGEERVLGPTGPQREDRRDRDADHRVEHELHGRALDEPDHQQAPRPVRPEMTSDSLSSWNGDPGDGEAEGRDRALEHAALAAQRLGQLVADELLDRRVRRPASAGCRPPEPCARSESGSRPARACGVLLRQRSGLELVARVEHDALAVLAGHPPGRLQADAGLDAGDLATAEPDQGQQRPSRRTGWPRGSVCRREARARRS